MIRRFFALQLDIACKALMSDELHPDRGHPRHMLSCDHWVQSATKRLQLFCAVLVARQRACGKLWLGQQGEYKACFGTMLLSTAAEVFKQLAMWRDSSPAWLLQAGQLQQLEALLPVLRTMQQALPQESVSWLQVSGMYTAADELAQHLCAFVDEAGAVQQEQRKRRRQQQEEEEEEAGGGAARGAHAVVGQCS
jgi:hypothetical protein